MKNLVDETLNVRKKPFSLIYVIQMQFVQCTLYSCSKTFGNIRICACKGHLVAELLIMQYMHAMA